MSMRMSHRRGLECDTAPMVSGHQSGGGVRMRNTHSHDHDIFWSALTPHSGSQQSLDRSFSPSHEDTVSGPGPAHNLQVPQYCQYDPHV